MKQFVALLLGGLLLLPGSAYAEEPALPAAPPKLELKLPEPGPTRTPVQWNWKTFKPSEVTVTALSLSALTASFFMAPSAPRWTATNSIDEAARDALKLSSQSAITLTRNLTTMGLVLSLAIPIGGGAIQWIENKNDEEAAKKAGMIVMSLSFTLGLDGIVKNVVARARPCTREGDTSCSAPDAYRSFFSGHTAAAFTGAALCWSEKLNWAVCSADTVVAAAVGTGRIMGDNHYLSDVAVGAAVGIFSGGVLPWLTGIQLGPEVAQGTDQKTKKIPERAVTLNILPSFSAGTANGFTGVSVNGTF